MPIVPDVPEHGGDQDDDQGTARLSGPLFRDEPFHDQPPRDEPYRDQNPSAQPYAAVPQNPEPMPDAPQPAQSQPPPQKKSAGRDLAPR